MNLVSLGLSEIDVPPRFRVEYGNLEATKKSINEKGLLHPLTVTKVDGKWTLVAGMRRFLCCQQLGWEEVPCNFVAELDELARRECELLENLERKQLTMAEEVRATEEILELRRKKYESIWTDAPQLQSELAKELEISEAKLSQDLALARGFRKYPELMKEEKKTTALKRLRALQERELKKKLAGILWQEREDVSLLLGDCRKYLAEMEEESVNLIITDPPWGVHTENAEFVRGYVEVFDDSGEEVFGLLEETLPTLYRVLQTNSHMYFFFATKHYTKIYALLVSAGFGVSPIPLIWNKGSGQNISPNRKFTPTYETVFFCSKGDRLLNFPSGAVFSYPIPSEKIHPTEKPVELLEQFVLLSSVEGEIVLDPFAGSGSTLVAGRKNKRKVVGIELSEHFYNSIRLRLETEGGI